MVEIFLLLLLIFNLDGFGAISGGTEVIVILALIALGVTRYESVAI